MNPFSSSPHSYAMFSSQQRSAHSSPVPSVLSASSLAALNGNALRHQHFSTLSPSHSQRHQMNTHSADALADADAGSDGDHDHDNGVVYSAVSFVFDGSEKKEANDLHAHADSRPKHHLIRDTFPPLVLDHVSTPSLGSRSQVHSPSSAHNHVEKDLLHENAIEELKQPALPSAATNHTSLPSPDACLEWVKRYLSRIEAEEARQFSNGVGSSVDSAASVSSRLLSTARRCFLEDFGCHFDGVVGCKLRAFVRKHARTLGWTVEKATGDGDVFVRFEPPEGPNANIPPQPPQHQQQPISQMFGLGMDVNNQNHNGVAKKSSLVDDKDKDFGQDKKNEKREQLQAWKFLNLYLRDLPQLSDDAVPDSRFLISRASSEYQRQFGKKLIDVLHTKSLAGALIHQKHRLYTHSVYSREVSPGSRDVYFIPKTSKLLPNSSPEDDAVAAVAAAVTINGGYGSLPASAAYAIERVIRGHGHAKSSSVSSLSSVSSNTSTSCRSFREHQLLDFIKEYIRQLPPFNYEIDGAYPESYAISHAGEAFREKYGISFRDAAKLSLSAFLVKHESKLPILLHTIRTSVYFRPLHVRVDSSTNLQLAAVKAEREQQSQVEVHVATQQAQSQSQSHSQAQPLAQAIQRSTPTKALFSGAVSPGSAVQRSISYFLPGSRFADVYLVENDSCLEKFNLSVASHSSVVVQCVYAQPNMPFTQFSFSILLFAFPGGAPSVSLSSTGAFGSIFIMDLTTLRAQPSFGFPTHIHTALFNAFHQNSLMKLCDEKDIQAIQSVFAARNVDTLQNVYRKAFGRTAPTTVNELVEQFALNDVIERNVFQEIHRLAASTSAMWSARPLAEVALKYLVQNAAAHLLMAMECKKHTSAAAAAASVASSSSVAPSSSSTSAFYKPLLLGGNYPIFPSTSSAGNSSSHHSHSSSQPPAHSSHYQTFLPTTQQHVFEARRLPQLQHGEAEDSAYNSAPNAESPTSSTSSSLSSASFSNLSVPASMSSHCASASSSPVSSLNKPLTPATSAVAQLDALAQSVTSWSATMELADVLATQQILNRMQSALNARASATQQQQQQQALAHHHQSKDAWAARMTPSPAHAHSRKESGTHTSFFTNQINSRYH